ncbi:hypothetical protein DBV14_13895 [Variovorax sp. KBW07]|uniref:Spy/CpxP family protein refolding chaperone n=1 Tax=Variovorax sp. KBW07 TaxID=2153358 RepID=UPI000F5768BD|nr:Spy/CpxP family protein refolding chaperone [Variovorax sp. KBW07]RQO53538.1 hypothetical protein DBV14_13895 [Variovorax sp. KBW07]
MISLRQRIVWASLLGSAALASSGAFAQAPAAPATPAAPAAAVAQADGTAAAPKAKAEHKRMDPAQRMERMQAHRAKRLAALKEKLKLTSAQEGAWSTFTAASQPPAGAGPRPRMDRAEFAKLTTPERLERMQARQAERSAMFAKRADATKTFYAALTPEQQKTFDAETVHFGGHGHRGHHGEHGGPRGAAPAKG